MFLDNHTRYPAKLARAHLTDEHAVASVNLELRFSLALDGRLELEREAPRRETDPPDIGGRPLWREVSLAATGTVLGPSRPPFQRVVRIAVGELEHRLVVFGSRVWSRDSAGSLQATSPEPFDALALEWSQAFGGSYELAPGLLPGTDLPHPGGKVTYPLNPEGMGFFADEEAALGQPLPRIELADEPIREWSDRPTPGGLAPCPSLVALRMDAEPPEEVSRWAERAAASVGKPARLDSAELLGQIGPEPSHIDKALRIAHHAPGALIVEDLAPGSVIALDGLGPQPLTITLPPSPIAVEARRGRSREPVAPRLRSVHVDADRRETVVAWGHETIYDPSAAPQWLEVSPSSSR